MRFPSLTLLRAALWTTAAANLAVAGLVLEPQSAFARLAGLPDEPVPAVFRVLLALFLVLFGATYAWLASRAVIDRPLLSLGAVGKTVAFVAVLGLWTMGLASARFMLLMVGDLLFATLFFAWLFGEGRRGS